MPKTVLTTREANQDFGRAKRAAESGPVIITDRGKPAHVLLTHKSFERLQRKHEQSAAEALGMTEGADIEFDPPRFRDLAREADLG